MSVLSRSCFIACLFVLCCFGGLPEPRTPTEAFFSKDRSKILVVLSEHPPDKDKGRLITLPSGEQLDLRSTVTNSGCYWIESFKPVYLLDWRANYYEKVFASEDLDHAAKANRRGMDMNGAWGLKFFTKGNQVESYACQQLVRSKGAVRTPFATVGYYYQWIDEERTGFAAGTFILKTSPRYLFVSQRALKVASGKTIVFDQASGQIIRRQQDHFLQYVFGVGVVLAVIVWFVWKRSTRETKADA